MAEIYVREPDSLNSEPVSRNDPFPVYVPEDRPGDPGLPPMAHRTKRLQVAVPGITTQATAYADGDTIGFPMRFPGVFRTQRRSGLLHTATFYDPSDSIVTQVDMHFFRQAVPNGTDNGAWAISDANVVLAWLGSVSWTTFIDIGGAKVGTAVNVGIALESADTDLWAQLVARAAYTITAGSEPYVAVAILQD